jgi:acylphosphatase
LVDNVRIQFRVFGRVQGVGFRYFTVRAAITAGVSGIVRNEADGSVVAEAEGELEAVACFEELLRRGPQGARVDGVSSDKRQEGASVVRR